MPLADAQGWEPLLLGGLPLLDDILSAVQRVRTAACGNWKPPPGCFPFFSSFNPWGTTICFAAVTKFLRKGRVGTTSLMQPM